LVITGSIIDDATESAALAAAAVALRPNADGPTANRQFQNLHAMD
jgi:hypothetical protein